MEKNNQFVFFWSGPFSQWHTSSFSINGFEYNCAEQFMMHCKALLFGDIGIANAIIHAKEPKEQKSLGRKIKGFDEKRWEIFREGIVFSGNHAKFSQNYFLKKELLATKGKLLVEASPRDKIWGIGLSESDPRAKDPNEWKGLNLLGKTLTRVRGAIEDEDQAFTQLKPRR